MSSIARNCYFCGEPQIKVGSQAHRVFELLLDDPGFSWTAREVSDRLDLDVGTVRQVLGRLAKTDAIRTRRHQTHLGARVRYSAHHQPADRTWPPTLTAGYLCSCGQFLKATRGVTIRIVLDAHKPAHLGMRR